MRIGVLGHIGLGETMLNGQTVKTKNLVDGIIKYTDIKVTEIDSHGWLKRPLRLLGNIKKAFQECNAIIMLPAQNGVRVFSPVLVHYKKKYEKKIFYDVIGGWLPEFLADKPRLAEKLKKFDGIWVETSTMKKKLEDMGFSNVTVIPNFKELQPLDESELVYPDGIPYRLCTFSRIMKEKGIETAADAVVNVNERLGYTAYSLDIYGAVDGAQVEWFENLKKNFPFYVQYKGMANPEESVDIVKNYFALLFPTHFFTEGIPGTIIDAYVAGVPVISAKWESFADVIEEGKTGIGYDFENFEMLEDILLKVAQAPKILLDMKANCIERASKYTPEATTKKLSEKIRGGGITSIR